MSDNDPPIEPLRPIDPLAPESKESDIGRLEPIDPEADDAPEASAPPAPEAVVSTPTRARTDTPRYRVGIAAWLAALLAMSSIAAIGGLVVISMQTEEPPIESATVAPVESSEQMPTIRVERSAPEPEARDHRRPADRTPGPIAASPVSYSAPTPAAATGGADTAGDAGKGDSAEVGKGGHGRGQLGVGGAWCDAGPGTACDAAVGGGSVVQSPSAG